MSQDVNKTELQEQTQQLMNGPLKHIRAAALAAALIPLAAVTASAQATSQNGSCLFSGGACGFVFNDTNNNGLQDVGETGIPNVEVTICQVCDGNDTQTAFTNNDGYWEASVTGFPISTYTAGISIPTGKTPSPYDAPLNTNTQDTIDSDGQVSGTFVLATVSVGTAADFGFNTPAAQGPGTGTPGYWKNHPNAWPVSNIVIGSNTYTKAQAIALLGNINKDKTTTMFAQYVSAYLNLQLGNNGTCITDFVTAAYNWLSAYPVGSGVAASSAAWSGSGQGNVTSQTLDAYNNGQLCAPHRN